MKTTFTRSLNTYLLLLCLALTACGGGSGSDSPTSGEMPSEGGATTALLEGRVADGYLVGARVFLDRNFNKKLDAGEPWAESKAGGRFALTVTDGDGKAFPVVAEILAGKTIDEDGGSRPVIRDYLLEAPIGRHGFISPLTTLVKNELDKNPSFFEQDAEIKVRSALGISDNVSLFADYIEQERTAGAGGDSLANDYLLAHAAARVVAGVMGELFAGIEGNLGGSIPLEQFDAVALMASDAIMSNSQPISQALGEAARNDGEVAVENLIVQVLGEIDQSLMDQASITLYKQRLGEKHPTWDVTPPGVVLRLPGSGDFVPVDSTIVITFDETLDKASLGEGTVLLSGPSGPVAGILAHEPGQNRLVFTPSAALLALSDYRVTLGADLSDRRGNMLGETVSWEFKTLFDQIPPAPPIF